ncbi:MAG: hypothetical protein QME96_18735, partial [Myxococcota bacterium]|nr:hypothetical protein [Myxococcota bacterium]
PHAGHAGAAAASIHTSFRDTVELLRTSATVARPAGARKAAHPIVDVDANDCAIRHASAGSSRIRSHLRGLADR